ncbi:MAG: NAD(+) synthase [Clostridiales bacterium]|nr:NAD(+) synthase [Clostridiales bacterium]
MNFGFVRVAAASPDLRVADCAYNIQKILEAVREAAALHADLIVFPELCVTGYTCGDLFLQKCLLDAAQQQLCLLAERAKEFDIVIAAGLPAAIGGQLYNCAAVLYGGAVLGLIPKAYLPNYAEFYEQRHFSALAAEDPPLAVHWQGRETPVHPNLLFSFAGPEHFVLGVEICEDLWAPIPPSSYHVLAGATVIANLSASNETTGKSEYRRALVANQSARSICGYVYACAGAGESTTDLVFPGHNIIAENGRILRESPRFSDGILCADLDAAYLDGERRRNTSFFTHSRQKAGQYFVIPVPHDTALIATPLLRPISPAPFVPSDPARRSERCDEILTMQAAGLKKRIQHVNVNKVVLGVSGGLDSTLALLICARAFDWLALPREGIQAVTMPCFGTSKRTYKNARALAELSGASLLEIPIAESVSLHFKDIGQDPSARDLTYENAQARERTQVLMDIAAKVKGFVVGTGDLSELALGFATYNGDHMSMYGVNASVPKTLIRYLIAYAADTCEQENLRNVLYEILDTPVSPELLPPENDGGADAIAQKTEEILGPYEAHDFFLYYTMRLGFPPDKIFYLAQKAFAGVYDRKQILGWLKIFYTRFFSNQFKRSCLPDGPKVGSAALSPRGDWRMPSDASAALWMDILNRLECGCKP